MKTTFGRRVLLLIGGILLMAGLTLWGVHAQWVRMRSIEQKLTGAQWESFSLAAEFQQQLLALNHALLRFAARREPAIWAEFNQSSSRLGRWLDDQFPRLTSDHERKILDELNRAFDDYVAAAQQVYTNQPPPRVSSDGLVQMEGFERQAQRLLQLGTDLSNAHREAQESFLDAANESLGSIRWFLFATVALMLGLAGAFGWLLYRDLIAPLRTRLLESEALLVQQEKLATLGTLAAGIAHEIRNPLTSIKARLYMLGKHMEGHGPASADAAVISGEIARLERIVQQVLQFARPSDPQRHVLPADQPLREVQALLTDTLEKAQVRLVIEPGPSPLVSVDPALIKQVLINLVRNGAEAITQAPGTVTLRVRVGRANLQGNDQPVAILEVSDTGGGIPPEIQPRLLDPFFTTKQTGTGLGLSIAARIVEKHGGKLQYQTRVGHGTTFGIVLATVDPTPGPDGKPAAR